MKLQVIHFAANSDLPDRVRNQIPDEEIQSVFRAVLNSHLGDGRTEMHAYLKAWKMLSESGYEQNKTGQWVQKDSPAVGDVHVPAPMGSAIRPKGQREDLAEIGTTGLLHTKEKDDEEKDDPGTQDVSLPEDPFVLIPPIMHQKADVSKRISGNSPIGLNVKGEQLAEKLGRRIKLKGGLDVIHSSDLPRAVQTADCIVKYNPECERAAPKPNLRPWRLGAIEGKQPGDVEGLVKHYIEHPDEVPPGKGRDGKPGESFNSAVRRQLGELFEIYQGSIDHPNMKIGIVMHSRGMELLQAAVDKGMEPGDDVYEFHLKTEDLLNPNDPEHADMLRWHNDKIKEVDVDEDDELRPGVYPILHSLTDDDTDEGNEELEKQDGIPPNLKDFTDPLVRCGTCSYFTQATPDTSSCAMFNGYPVNADQVCDEHVQGKPGTQGGQLVARKYAPPLEVQKAAAAALEAGASVLDVTEPLATGEGLAIPEICKVAEWHASVLAATAPSSVKEAWGGKHAAKWVGKIIAKVGKDGTQWPSWIAEDLDGVLAENPQEGDESFDGTQIGKPIAAEVARVKQFLKEGKKVKIFTARIADDPDGKIERAIKAWCKEHIGQELPVTNEKDPGMVQIRDDKAQRVENGVEKADAGELILKSGSGVMVAFMIDPVTAKKLAIKGGEEPDQMHVTLAYLGKLADMDMEELPALEGMLQEFAEAHAPVEATLGGPARFNATAHSDNLDVCIATVESKDIQEFRECLVDCMAEAGINVVSNFGYTPHVSLAYIKPGADFPVQRIDPIFITFDRITLCIGGARKEYVLSGSASYEDGDIFVKADDTEQDNEDKEKGAVAGIPHPHRGSLIPRRPKAPGRIMPRKKSDEDFEIVGEIIKLDKPRQIAFGWFSVVEIEGRPVQDTQGDVITEETIETTAYDFVLNARKGGEMHEQNGDGEVRGVGRLIESVVFTREKQAAMLASLQAQKIDASLDLHCVCWWGGMKIDNSDTWDKVTAGELRAWSIGGRGKRAAL
jgi:broad specificity phosphatase PhoE/2'-5' RNA ligase/cation transport regulator ChaB